MSKQAAKHHREPVRRERAGRRVKRGGKPTSAKKPVTQKEHGVREAYVKPSPTTVEVMEVEVVSFPEEPLEVDEAEPSLPDDVFVEEED